MIGWWIVIAQETPDERDANLDKKIGVIASWECSVNGTKWLCDMAAHGKATQLRTGGYPTRYVALARDVLPLIANGTPKHDGITIVGDDYVIPGDWCGNVTLHHEKIANCPPEQILTIDAWDLD